VGLPSGTKKQIRSKAEKRHYSSTVHQAFTLEQKHDSAALVSRLPKFSSSLRARKTRSTGLNTPYFCGELAPAIDRHMWTPVLVTPPTCWLHCMKLINWVFRFEINMSGLNKFHTTIPENICRWCREEKGLECAADQATRVPILRFMGLKLVLRPTRSKLETETARHKFWKSILILIHH
jgi:hypothetical protein